MVTKHNAYDVQLASKTNPAARYVLATDYAKLAAENAELRKDLTALREVIAPGWSTLGSMDMVQRARKILYPTQETDNEMD